MKVLTMYQRQRLGSFGVSGPVQTALMGTLSDGQRSRVVFALLAIDGPNMILVRSHTLVRCQGKR